MPVNVTGPRIISPSGSDTGLELVYTAKDESDRGLVRAGVLAVAPATYDGLARGAMPRIEPITADSWEVTVGYGDQGGVAISSSAATLLSWNSLGGTQHITQSYLTPYIGGGIGAGGAETLVDFKGAIAVGDDWQPAGVDVPLPTFNFVIRKRFAPSALTPLFISRLYGLTGKKNGAAWTVTISYPSSDVTLTLAFRKGEVCFFGADCPEPANDGYVYITYTFGRIQL